MSLHTLQVTLDTKGFSNDSQAKQIQQRLNSIRVSDRERAFSFSPDCNTDCNTPTLEEKDADPYARVSALSQADVKEKDQDCPLGQDMSIKLTDLVLKVKTST